MLFRNLHYIFIHDLFLHRLSLLAGLEWQDGLEREDPCWAQRGDPFQCSTDDWILKECSLNSMKIGIVHLTSTLLILYPTVLPLFVLKIAAQ